MNKIKIAKQLIRLAQHLISSELEESLAILNKKDQKKYQDIVKKAIKDINDKIKTFDLHFEYQLQLQDDLIYDDYDDYLDAVQDNDMSDYIGKALFTYMNDAHILPVVVNTPYLYSEYLIGNLSLNDIERQIKITLYHQLAHGLINYYEDNGENIPFDHNDEDVAEEFGQAMGDLHKSQLGRFILNFECDEE